MLGTYPSPRFSFVGLQKQWLGKPSPRCNLEWVYTCEAVETRYLGDQIVYTKMSPLTQICQSKGVVA